MFIFAFYQVAYSHPAELNLFGHDMAVVLEDGQINLKYALEFPLGQLASELQLFLDDNELPQSQVAETFISNHYVEMLENLSLEIDGKPVLWTKVSQPPDKLKREAGFAVFEFQLSADIPPNSQQISLLNMVRAPDNAIYRTGLFIGDDVYLNHADLLDVAPSKTEPGHMRWEKNDQRRELRVSFGQRDSILAFLHRHWRRLFHLNQTYPLPSPQAIEDRDGWIWGRWRIPGPLLATLFVLVSGLSSSADRKRGIPIASSLFLISCLLLSHFLYWQPAAVRLWSLLLLIVPIVGRYVFPHRWSLPVNLVVGGIVLTIGLWVGIVCVFVALLLSFYFGRGQIVSD